MSWMCPCCQLNVDVYHVSGWPSLLCDPVIWVQELLICSCSMSSFSWGWLIWAIALPITWRCRLACASYMLNCVVVMLDDRTNSKLLQNIIFLHIHSLDPVIDLNCQHSCNLTLTNLFPLKTCEVPPDSWASVHPLHHCLLAICFQALWFSVKSAEMLPTKDITELTASYTRCLHVIQECGHDVRKEAEEKNQHVLTTVLWPSAKHAKSVNVKEDWNTVSDEKYLSCTLCVCFLKPLIVFFLQ